MHATKSSLSNSGVLSFLLLLSALVGTRRKSLNTRVVIKKKKINKRLMSDLLPQINSISMATVTSVWQNIQDFSKEKLKYLKCHFSWKHHILSLNRFPKHIHSTCTGRRAFWLSRASSANASEYISLWQTGPTAAQT